MSVWGRRRLLLAACGTVAAAGIGRKPVAAAAPEFAARLRRALDPQAPPEAAFTDAEGSRRTVADHAGQGLVINFWATWCAPCVREMPALAALARTLAPRRILVLPLSSDRGGAAVVGPWYAERGIVDLPVLLDPRGAMARAWGVRGLPTTVILDRAGLEVARLEGAAEWDAPEVAAAVAALVEGH